MVLAIRNRGRRKVEPNLPKSRDEFSIRGPAGSRPAKYHVRSLALVEAQAEADRGDKPIVLTVESSPLISGRTPTPVFHIERCENGTVITTVLSRED